MTAAMREAAAKVADDRAEMRRNLFEQNGASINASKAVEAEEIAAAIRALPVPQADDIAQAEYKGATIEEWRALAISLQAQLEPVLDAEEITDNPQISATEGRCSVVEEIAPSDDVDRVALAIIEAINPNRDFRLNPHHEDELSGWRRTARAAIAALPRDQIEADGWRPIETAPKDGRFMIGARFDGSEFLWAKDLQWLTTGDVADLDGYGEPDESTEPGWYHGDDEIVGATHWRPLPAPPVRHPDGETARG